MPPSLSQDKTVSSVPERLKQNAAIAQLASLHEIEPYQIAGTVYIREAGGDYVSTPPAIQGILFNPIGNELVSIDGVEYRVNDLAKKLEIPTEDLMMIKYITKNGTKISHTLVRVIRSQGKGSKVQLVDVWEHGKTKDIQPTLFYYDKTLSQTVNEILITVGEITYSERQRRFSSETGTTMGCDRNRIGQRRIVIEGELTPNIDSDARSRSVIAQYVRDYFAD